MFSYSLRCFVRWILLVAALAAFCIVFQHANNCSTGNIYDNDITKTAVKDKSHDAGMVATDVVKFRRTARLAVLLSELPRKSNGSLKLVNEQFPNTVHSHPSLFHTRKLVIWSTDHHPSPAYDAKHLLQPLGVKFLQHDLSPYCSFFNLCEERKSLKVLSLVIKNMTYRFTCSINKRYTLAVPINCMLLNDFSVMQMLLDLGYSVYKVRFFALFNIKSYTKYKNTQKNNRN